MHRIANVKWVKISTDIFDNSKIKYIRRLPDGDTLALVWVALLTIAGRCNANGYVYLTEDIPYTSQILADELGAAEPTITLALSMFERLKMIENHNGFIYVSGWAEHQNVDGMDRIREQTRKRVAKHREARKLLPSGGDNSCNVTSSVTVTRCNATDKERRIRDRYNNIYPQIGDGACAFDAPNGTPNVDNSASIDEQPAPMAARPTPKRKPRKKADRAETPEFIRFYTEYPRHEARAAAWEAWAKLDPSPELVETIIDHVQRRKTTAWRGVEKQHIPHPSTFINQRRWTDELPKRSGFSSQEIDY